MPGVVRGANARPRARVSSSAVAPRATTAPPPRTTRRATMMSARARASRSLTSSSSRLGGGTRRSPPRPARPAVVVAALADDDADDAAIAAGAWRETTWFARATAAAEEMKNEEKEDDFTLRPVAVSSSDDALPLGIDLPAAAASVAIGLAVKFLLPCPAELSSEAWSLLAVFAAAVAGLGKSHWSPYDRVPMKQRPRHQTTNQSYHFPPRRPPIKRPSLSPEARPRRSVGVHVAHLRGRDEDALVPGRPSRADERGDMAHRRRDVLRAPRSSRRASATGSGCPSCARSGKTRSGAFYTLVPMRPRRRGERLSTPLLTPFNSTPTSL